ncbi:helix-turn-helix transcriptional regulator [Streptomyces sp. DSM 44917]|uniref:Helix-turn-helix transcriptional regulator n=1 Tax=Streptomyces boetiae TaxID=3075541 RepID=A0ABU2L9N9_9ACTN|nr:helix-turn-helix transcriptional regulator [Streptomyces sp. DSM 44917]MDT0307993.1 helix-turn-helix transcriptional regulator [Streptomyces sp. DSM 44917]
MTTTDRAQLADFLRTRREALQPEDVGLPRGPRRRTRGLRREEVAALCAMSADYYTRIEQQRGPLPSPPMLAAIARGLRLSLAERDHLFRLAGHRAPGRPAGRGAGGAPGSGGPPGGGGAEAEHVSPGVMRVLDRLNDTPAQVVTSLGETLVQTRLAVALLGDETRFTGPARSGIHRWFTDPASRLLYPEADHDRVGRVMTSNLRAAYARDGAGSFAAEILDALLAAEARGEEGGREFGALWRRHEIGLRWQEPKRIAHPDLGVLTLHCQVLHDAEQDHALLVFTATPGTESHEKLQLLPVLGDRQPST